MADIGIDLGTTYALVGMTNQQAMPVLIPDANNASEFRTPTLVHLSGQNAQVGHVVEDLLVDDPDSPVARGFKPFMGSAEWMFQDSDNRHWHAESLSTLMLRKLLRDVELFTGEVPDRAVIAVPANFNDTQRKATKLSAALAGLGHVKLVEEPIAAAVFYGLTEKSAEQTLLVYDFGGGTFDASVIQIADSKVHVLASDGDSRLGGLALDQRIVDFLLAECRRQHGVQQAGDTATLEVLRRYAEELKILFSQPGKQQVRRMIIVAGKVLELHFSREQIEHLLHPVVEETLEVTARCLKSTGLGWRDVDKVLLAGGSSLIPHVTRRLAEVSGKPLDAIGCRQPHQAVAYGAALLAADAQDTNSDALDFPVAPYNLGLQVRDPQSGTPGVDVMIKRNSALPARHTKTFFTNRPDQTRLILHVVQSKAGNEVAHSLGTIAFGPLKRPQKNLPIEVTLAYDREGMVRITARDGISGESVDQMIGKNGRVGASLPPTEGQCLDRIRLL